MSGELVDMATDAKIVNRSGSWYSYGEIRIGQGRDNAKLFLEANPEIFAEIENKVRSHFSIGAEGKKESANKEAPTKGNSKKGKK